MLGSRARYAIRALLELSLVYPEGPVALQHVADRQTIPLKYLQQIMLELRQAGLVVSRKGPGGGYGLARPPHEVSIADVLVAIDGSIVGLQCHGDAVECECVNFEECAVRKTLDELSCGIQKVVKGVTFAHLAESQRHMDLSKEGAFDFSI